MKLKPVWVDLNPKAVTTNELFGYINPATREWKDGVCVEHSTAACMYVHVYGMGYRVPVILTVKNFVVDCFRCSKISMVKILSRAASQNNENLTVKNFWLYGINSGSTAVQNINLRPVRTDLDWFYPVSKFLNSD